MKLKDMILKELKRTLEGEEPLDALDFDMKPSEKWKHTIPLEYVSAVTLHSGDPHKISLTLSNSINERTFDFNITNDQMMLLQRDFSDMNMNEATNLKEMVKEELQKVLKETAAIGRPAVTPDQAWKVLDDLYLKFASNDFAGAMREGGIEEQEINSLYAALTAALGYQKDDGPVKMDEGRYRGRGYRGKSVTDGMPVLQGTAKEIDDLIGAAIDAHRKADEFAAEGATDFATHMDQAVGIALNHIEPLLSKMNPIAIEKTMPHLAAARSSSGQERLDALGKAKDALVPR